MNNAADSGACPPQWKKWMGCVDVVQMNEQEGALLAGETLDSKGATRRFAKQVLCVGPFGIDDHAQQPRF